MNFHFMDWLARLRQALRSRYVRMLESEIARERSEIDRLRQEIRALLNSLLGTAGVPPIEAPPAHPAQIAPIRRRSWSQIAATREIEAGRQSHARDQSAHPPRNS
jgi:uncharacterized coiled-coil protein SlyX